MTVVVAEVMSPITTVTVSAPVPVFTDERALVPAFEVLTEIAAVAAEPSIVFTPVLIALIPIAVAPVSVRAQPVVPAKFTKFVVVPVESTVTLSVALVTMATLTAFEAAVDADESAVPRLDTVIV